MKASDFSLPDQNGKTHKLSDYLGKWVVLYFYPKDDTPGCTVEATNFRDNLEVLDKENIVVLGVSKDTSASHMIFAEKFDLNFTLLSDEDGKVINDYKCWGVSPHDPSSKEEGILRKTFIINPEGEIVRTYETVNPDAHAVEVLQDIRNLKSS